LSDFINVRLRKDKDDDIATWYKAQDDRSEAVRAALRLVLALKDEVGRWYERQDDPAEAILKAIEAYRNTATQQEIYKQGEQTLDKLAELDALGDDVRTAIEHLEIIETLLERGVTLSGCSEDDELDEPEQALASLDKLADLA
jgi:Arc/MetJ-type ribon-helix-helix transcriptional regulator